MLLDIKGEYFMTKENDLQNLQKKITDAYSADFFNYQGNLMVDMLTEHLKTVTKSESHKNFSDKTPEEIVEIFKCDFKNKSEKSFIEIEREILKESMPLHSPKYIGHQMAAPLPLAALSDMMMALLNNCNAVFETGRVAVGAEIAITKWMCSKIGFDDNAGGFLTSGGTLGNLTALLCAREVKNENDVWEHGVCKEKLAILVPEESHYSINRAAAIMGLGNDGAIQVASDENHRMRIDELKSTYEKAKKDGKKVFAVVANACSTATGTYDNLIAIADFCKEHDLWMHVDGAHGAPALLSKNYKGLLKGIENADSVVWDGHKMMMMPTVVTGVLFKDHLNTQQTFSQKASYLYEHTDEFDWYNFGKRTLECTKPFMSLKLYTALKYYGEEFFGNFIDYTYGLTREFANIIENSEDFELATQVQSNIICFRYLKKDTDLSKLQNDIRNKLLAQRDFYIVKTDLRGETYLRCTVINPYTGVEHLRCLLDDIREIAKTL